MLEQVNQLHSLIKYTSAFFKFFLLFFFFCGCDTRCLETKRRSIAFATAVEGEGDTHKRSKKERLRRVAGVGRSKRCRLVGGH